jgi:hypothetical protein
MDAANDGGDGGDAGTHLMLTLDNFTLQPAFSENVHDYAVRCAAGMNPTTVTATAPTGVTVAMLEPTSVPLDQPVPITMNENDAVVVEATGPNGVEDYWVRCLPHDFPKISPTRYAKTNPGYYITGNTTLGADEAGYVMVFDGNATPVWYRAAGMGNTAALVTVVAKDTIGYMASVPNRFGTDPNGHFQIVNLDTAVETQVKTVGSATDEHELLPLTNGNYILLSYPATTGIDMSSRGVTNTTTIADCSIQEIAPDGSLAWSWLGSDHIDIVKESTEFGTGTIAGVNVIDPIHCNSVDVAANGDVLVSARQLDAVFLVSRATGNIVWKIGGIASSKDGAQIIQMQGDPETSFFHQHDARFLPNGNISLYDDHTTNFDSQMPPPNVARGMELSFDLTSSTATMVWQYQATIAASATGSFRRLDDGSSIVGWGFLGNTMPALAMTETDNVGNPLLELRFDLGGHAYRVLKVPTTSLDLDTMRKTAGK